MRPTGPACKAGSHKQSGRKKEMGVAGIEEFLEKEPRAGSA
jgi:hypothetical protein